MEILLVAATSPESAALRKELAIPGSAMGAISAGKRNGHRISLLHTGIGMVNTAYHLGRYLQGNSPGIVIQFGIAGSFEGGPEIGEVVEVTRECYAELGAESPDGFLDLREMGFVNFQLGEQPIFNEMRNPSTGQTDLQQCRGLTVNRVHGTADTIRSAIDQWSPEVESMEGAAFFQCCLLADIPFLQLRGISNRVEPRNRTAWKIREAAAAVQLSVLQFIDQL